MRLNSSLKCATVLIAAVMFVGCSGSPKSKSAACPKVGQPLARQGDEIVIAGQYFHTGTPVILWTDPGGYDAYRTERRFSPWEKASFEETIKEYKANPDRVDEPNRYGVRFGPSTRPGAKPLPADQFEKVRGGGWPLEVVKEKVDQFVYHYDVAGTSRNCFATMQDVRGISVHFMLDADGTIYQTLDVKERAWHATTANDRSIGIEIANIGAYSPNDDKKTLETWYRKDSSGRMRMVLPAWIKDSAFRTPNFVAYPARDEAVVGNVQGTMYRQYDLTPQQYDSLIRLTATLCTVLPNLNCDYPRDEKGMLITKKLPDDQLNTYKGLMGHYHVQTNKIDPGPAFQWDKIINGSRNLMGKKPLPPGDVINRPAESVAAKK